MAVFFLGCGVSFVVGRKFGINPVNSLILYIWHTLFSLFYCWYVLNAGGDAVTYFKEGQSWSGEFGVGTAAIRAISGILVSGMGLSILGAFLFFNIFGQIGLLAFWGSLKQATIYKGWRVRLLATLVVFLPSISFWSSALGKDAIAFMATGLALWSSLNLSKRNALMTIAVLLMFLVRPHMAGIMVIAITIATLMDGNASLTRRALVGFTAAATTAALIPFALRYAGLMDVLDVQAIMGYIDMRQEHNTDGGGGVDIAAMSLPMQMFTYLFRPMFFEVRNVFSLAAAIDNFILLTLFFWGGIGLLRRRKACLGENRIFMWTYSLGAWLVLAVTTANLGIALRQKWMFAPMLIFLLISIVGRRKEAVSKQENHLVQ